MTVIKGIRHTDPKKAHLQSIGEWAMGLPASAWKQGPPPPNRNIFYAVRLATGRIMTERGGSFSSFWLQRLAITPGFGQVLAYVEAGD